MVPLQRAGAFLCGLVLLHLPVGAAILIHEYALRGTLEDRFGGNSLTAMGGNITALGYVFSENQGLAFSSRDLTPANYSIELSFKFDATVGLSKIIDFQNLTANAGLYQYNGRLAFDPYAKGSVSNFTAGTDMHLVLTRDGATNLVTAYLNGQQTFSFVDPLSLAAPPGDSSQLNFFIDDQLNASGGTANYLRVFNGALTASEVSSLFAAGAPVMVPEPSTFILVAIGATTLLFASRRSSKR